MLDFEVSLYTTLPNIFKEQVKKRRGHKVLYPLSYKAIFYYFSCPDGTRTRNFPNLNRSIPYLRHCSVSLCRKQMAEKADGAIACGDLHPRSMAITSHTTYSYNCAKYLFPTAFLRVLYYFQRTNLSPTGESNPAFRLEKPTY